MKAIVVHEFGDTDKLALEEVPVPRPHADEVALDVAFAGVGFVDTLIRAGRFDNVPRPVIPGIEVSGYVREVGSDVKDLVPGQRVAALLTDYTSGGMGGYAEVARAKAALTIPLMPEDDLATAAATLVNGATAFLAMEGTEPGATIAISGASGGLGQWLIAAAMTSRAAKIIAISGNTARHESLLQAGATTISAPEDFDTASVELDAAFDTVGGDVRLRMMRHLKPLGRLVLLGNASGMDPGLSGDELWLRSLKIEGLATGGLSPFFPEKISKAARRALSLAAERPVPTAVLDLHQAKEAHRALETRQGQSKFVLRVR